MRRLKILFFWIFINKNNVSLKELMQFLVKPTVRNIAKEHRKSTRKTDLFEVQFHNLKETLYWPKQFSVNRLDQIIAETFDTNDWHYYQKQHTEVAPGEIILDIGTAEGLFPLTVIEKCEHIYLVEPSRLFVKCLEKTFAAFADKVTIFNTAVGNHDGMISFDENSLEGMISNDHSVEKISIHKVDTLLEDDRKITYLKADIEGFELEMLKGAEQTIKRNKPKIAITTYHSENNPDEIIKLIKSFVPEYNHYVKGIYELTPKPVMIHFWV